MMKLPTENQESAAFTCWLRNRAILFCHVPNEGFGTRTKGQAAHLKRIGMSAGVPDYLIFTTPPNRPDARGIAIEMKRRKGGKVSEYQQKWIDSLNSEGWVATVCAGAKNAMDFMTEMGF